jgi:phosphoadenosine phosphosulfate reductase
MNGELFEYNKVDIAIERIKQYEPEEGYYVAFSGGKDSVVITDLVKKAGVKYDAHYNITGVDPPELFYFIRDVHPDVVRHRPEMTMWALIVKKMMPPTRLIRYCCAYLKEGRGQGRVVVTGVRKSESLKRSKRNVYEQSTGNKKTYFLHPIIDWTENDVWEYIRSNNVAYCSLYDEGFKRLGCIGCPMAGRKIREKEFARWPAYEKLYRDAFDIAAQKNIIRLGNGTINGTRWKNGTEMFDWWMERGKKETKGKGLFLPDEASK